MTKIGVIGGSEVEDVLNELYEMTDEDITIRLVSEKDAAERFNILLINDFGFMSPKFLAELESGDAVVVNNDNKQLYKYLKGCRGRLITYGFSSKACVTASSVIDQPYECIQLCIQRTLPTLSGEALEPQEFPVVFKSPKNIHCALGAVTTALIAGLSKDSFSA